MWDILIGRTLVTESGQRAGAWSARPPNTSLRYQHPQERLWLSHIDWVVGFNFLSKVLSVIVCFVFFEMGEGAAVGRLGRLVFSSTSHCYTPLPVP